jgi:hypothetical protein
MPRRYTREKQPVRSIKAMPVPANERNIRKLAGEKDGADE